jgi:hypothetical protein
MIDAAGDGRGVAADGSRESRRPGHPGGRGHGGRRSAPARPSIGDGGEGGERRRRERRKRCGGFRKSWSRWWRSRRGRSGRGPGPTARGGSGRPLGWAVRNRPRVAGPGVSPVPWRGARRAGVSMQPSPRPSPRPSPEWPARGEAGRAAQGGIGVGGAAEIVDQAQPDAVPAAPDCGPGEAVLAKRALAGGIEARKGVDDDQVARPERLRRAGDIPRARHRPEGVAGPAAPDAQGVLAGHIEGDLQIPETRRGGVLMMGNCADTLGSLSESSSPFLESPDGGRQAGKTDPFPLDGGRSGWGWRRHGGRQATGGGICGEGLSVSSGWRRSRPGGRSLVAGMTRKPSARRGRRGVRGLSRRPRLRDPIPGSLPPA